MHCFLIALTLLWCSGANAQIIDSGVIGVAKAPSSSSCPYGTALADGCPGAQAHGTIVDANLATPKAVIDLSIIGGSGYTNGTFTWTASGGGCSTNATGTITVAGGQLGGAANGLQGNYTIINIGAGCTSRPTIAIPAGASGGSGGSITPTVYQFTPHNAAGTVGANWNVAGVDYPVGYDRTLSLKNPQTQNPNCTSFSGHTLTVTASNCTINGFDFTSPNHTLLTVRAGITGVVITNNKFACSPGSGDLYNIHITGAGTGVTIKYNTFYGASTAQNAGCIPAAASSGEEASIEDDSPSGTIVVEYNYCYQADAKCLNFGGTGSSATVTITEAYNYWVDFGTCVSYCQHGEAEYAYAAGSGQILTWTQLFNTVLIHFYAPGHSTSSLSIQADGVIINNPNSSYNMALVRANGLYTGNHNQCNGGTTPGSINNTCIASAAIYCGHQTPLPAGYTGTVTVANNILDYSGGYYGYNTSGGTCPSDIPTITNYNAGTGNSCGIMTCN